MNPTEAQKSIREMLAYILDVNDNDVIEGYAGTFDEIMESYAREHAIGFYIDRQVNDISREQADKIYSEWIKEQQG